MKLDKSQLAFCESDSLNCRLLAPAGCGKTNSLLFRCLNLLQRANRPQRFLLVSFTNAAAAELSDRIECDVTFEALRAGVVRATTLNAWGWRRLRDHYGSAKLLTDSTARYFAFRNQLAPITRKNDRIATLLSKSSAVRDLMNVIDSLKSLRFDHTFHKNEEKFNQHIDFIEKRGLSVLFEKQLDELIRLKVLDSSDDAEKIRRYAYKDFFVFWKEAVKRLHDELTFTFEDQKYWNYLNLPNAKPVPEPTRFHHVLVDEFQDINPLDLALIDLIVKANRASLTIVGDDHQAIFEWRGASPAFILEPDEHFGRSFSTYKLEMNYRSPPNIVFHSQKLISQNKRREKKLVRGLPTNADARIEIKSTQGIAAELDLVTNMVRETKPGRVGVIARMRAQLIPYEIHFASNEIDFETATDLDLFQNRALLEVTKMLEIRDNRDSQNYPNKNVEAAIQMFDLIRRRPLGRKDRMNIKQHLDAAAPLNVKDAVSAIANFPKNLSGKPAVLLHESATEFLNTGSTSSALRCLDKRFDGLSYDMEKAEREIFYINPPLEQLAELVEQRGWTGMQLAQMIQKAQSRINEFNSQSGERRIEGLNQRPLHLMTATRSKGKEFETVVILHALQGVWPHPKTKTEMEMEAERRLFYVAFTRAKEHVVILTAPKNELSASQSVREGSGSLGYDQQEHRLASSSVNLGLAMLEHAVLHRLSADTLL